MLYSSLYAYALYNYKYMLLFSIEILWLFGFHIGSIYSMVIHSYHNNMYSLMRFMNFRPLLCVSLVVLLSLFFLFVKDTVN